MRWDSMHCRMLLSFGLRSRHQIKSKTIKSKTCFFHQQFRGVHADGVGAGLRYRHFDSICVLTSRLLIFAFLQILCQYLRQVGARPKKMYGERLGDGVEYHLMSPAPRR